jgi:hypothetical protein
MDGLSFDRRQGDGALVIIPHRAAPGQGDGPRIQRAGVPGAMKMISLLIVIDVIADP